MNDLDALDKLEAAATSGPWHHAGCGAVVCQDFAEVTFGPDGEINCEPFEAAVAAVLSEASAHFVAALRNAYPSLAAEIRLLRGRVEMEHKSATMLREIYDILGPAARNQTAAEAVRLLRKHAEAMAEALLAAAAALRMEQEVTALAAYRADYPKKP